MNRDTKQAPMSHTPTPWHFNQAGNHPFVSSANGERVADCGPDDDNWIGWESENDAPSNARLIVRSVNNHDSLRDALKGMLEWARRVTIPNPGMEIANALKALRQAEEAENV